MRNSTDLAAAVESVVRVFLKMAGGVSPPAPQMKSALVLLSLFLAACSTPTAVRPAAEPKPEKAKIKQPSPYDSEFWKTWSDGQAEVAAYDLIMPKYGQLRRGTAIAITVAESFSRSAMVKADPGKHASSDVFAAIKLNLIRSYQTGIYNYKDMLSAFVALDEVNGRVPGMAAKITYSSQEWCGQVFSELLFSGSTVHQTRHSYFDGEADMQRSLQNAEEALAEDTVMLVARRIGWPRLRLGQRYETQMLTSLEAERSHHERVSYVPAAFTLAKERQTTTVPAGSFRTNSFTMKTGNRTGTWYVETDPPFRIVRWDSSGGERAVLIGTARMKYWQMNDEGGEKALEALGLTRRGHRMP